jgi:hypothetical protein
MPRLAMSLMLLVVSCLLIIAAPASAQIPQRKIFDGKLVADIKDRDAEYHTPVVVQADANKKTYVLYLRRGVSGAPDVVKSGQRVRIVWWADPNQGNKMIIDRLEVLNNR